MGLTNLPAQAQGTETLPPSVPSSTAARSASTAFPVPSYSCWFTFDAVHDIERRALPEFFEPENEESSPTANKYKTAAAYREYRDFMIHTFRMRPNEYLSVTTCRRHLTGDVVTLMRVHAFLEQWGLINYQAVSGATENANEALLSSSIAAVSLEAQQRALPATLDAWVKAEQSMPLLKCACCSSVIVSSLPAEAQNVLSYYHHPTRKITLCVSCFSEGKYPSEVSSGEFVRIDPAAFTSASPNPLTGTEQDWSPEDTLKLMEAVEKYSSSNVNLAANNVWDAIAETVGRTKEACLLHFLRIPAGDYLRQAASENIFGTSDANYLAFPFTQSENPILGVLAFLASSVHPRIAATASQAALSELARINAEASDKTDADAIVKDAQALQQVAATAIACSAVHARELAEQEEKRVSFWRDLLIETQLKKIQLKLDSLEELERAVETEKKEIEKQRLQIFMERFNLKKTMLQSSLSK